MLDAPKDIEAEQVVLASILLDEKAIHTVLDNLSVKDFFAEQHRLVFNSILALHKESNPIDVWTLKAELSRRGEFEKAGGIAGLNKLTEGIPVIDNVKYYCSIVRQKADARELMTMGSQITREAAGQEQSPREIIEAAQSRLLELYSRYQTAGPVPIADVADAGYKEIAERKRHQTGFGIKTGFDDIDKYVGGMRPGNVIIIAARPGCGKTSLAMSIGINVGKQSKRVLIFSLEMGNSELYCRMLATEAQIGVGGLLSGYFASADWSKIRDASGVISDQPILMDDSGSINMLQIGSRSKRVKMEHGLDLIVIDYLQLISGPGKSGYERVTAISREIKLLAKDLKIPIIVLSQLHRLEKEDTEPSLGDLRESGAIEQDADVVMFLWPGSDERVKKGKVAKQRSGPTGNFEIGFEPSQTRFFNIYGGRDGEV
jgi:replicative DNA helicase